MTLTKQSTKFTPLIYVLGFALLFRLLYAYLGWTTTVLEANDSSITVVYQRSAYLLAFGYGYQQTIPDSPSYFQLDSTIQRINTRQPYSSTILEEGRINTSHYPPGLPIIGAALFKLTTIPIAYIYQILGILIDLLTIYMLFLFVKKISNPQIALIAAGIYAISPQAAALSVSMTPDAYMPLLVTATAFFFLKFTEKKALTYIFVLAIINGIGGYLRSDFILLPFVFNLIFLFQWQQYKLYNILKYNIVIAAVSLLILSPWALHNKKVHDDFNPTSTSLGATLITGLSILPNPWDLGPTDYDRFAEANAMGFATPFETGANDMFVDQFKQYVIDEPGYYAKTCLYRTGYFFTAPHGWGLEMDKYAKTYSELRNEGAAFGSFIYLMDKYWSQMISAIFTILSFIAFGYLLKKNIAFEVKLIFISIFLSVYLSHVFIHMTSVYLMSLFPMQCFFIAFLANNFKFSKFGK